MSVRVSEKLKLNTNKVDQVNWSYWCHLNVQSSDFDHRESQGSVAGKSCSVLNNKTETPGNKISFCLPRNGRIYSLALLQATSAQTTSLVAAAEAARSSLEISELAQKAQDISVKRALWALQTIKVAAKAEEVAVNAIQTMFMWQNDSVEILNCFKTVVLFKRPWSLVVISCSFLFPKANVQPHHTKTHSCKAYSVPLNDSFFFL